MGGVKNVKFVREDMSKVNRVAFNAGMLARKLRVPTFYNIGADVIGVAGKALIKGYDAGGVRRMIDQTLRWQAGAYPSVVHGQRQFGGRDELFYGILKRKEFAYSPFVVTALQKGKTAFEKQPNTWAGKPIENGTPLGQVNGNNAERYNSAMQLVGRKGIQTGKTSEFCAEKDPYVGKPIENGTPYKKGWLSGISEDERIQKGKPADVNNATGKLIDDEKRFVMAASERDRNIFMEAYRLAAKGGPADIKEAKVKLNQIINARDKFSDSDIVIAAEDLLDKLGK